MSTFNFHYSAGTGAVKALQDVESGVLDSKHIEFARTQGGTFNDFLNRSLEEQAQERAGNVPESDSDAEKDRRYFAIEAMLREGYVPSKEQFQLLEYGREKYGQSKGEMIWGGIKQIAGAIGKGIVSTVETGDVINPYMLGTSLGEGTARGTVGLYTGVQNMANDSTHPLNSMFSSGELDERYAGFVKMMQLNNWYESKKKEGFVFDAKNDIPFIGTVRGFNEDLAEASSYVLDASNFIPGAGAIMSLPVKAPMALAAKGFTKLGISAGDLAVKAADIAQAGVVRPLGKFARGVEWATDGVLDASVGAIEKVSGVKMAHIGNGVITPMDMKVRAATRGGVVASTLSIPLAGEFASVWAGSKVVSTILDTSEQALQLAKDDLSKGVPSNLTIAERLRYQGSSAGVRIVGNVLDKASPVAQYLKTVAQNSYQGSLYGGAYGFIFGGEEGFYTGLGTGFAMGGTFGVLGATYNTIPTRAKGNQEIVKHFTYLMDAQDAPNKRGIARLLENVRKENGDEAVYQVMGQIVANKRLQKASKQLILTEEDIQALGENDQYVKWRDELLDPAFGGITFVKEPDGTIVQLVNADRAGTSAVSGEMFHTALMNSRYGLMFREEIRDAFLGNEDTGGTLWELPPDERVAVIRKFAEAYLGDNDPVIKGNQEILRADFERTIEMVARGEKPATLTKLFEEMAESLWNRWAQDKGYASIINDTTYIGDMFRNQIHRIKSLMATDIRSIGGDINFKTKDGIDGFFLDANGKRIKIPALDRVFSKLLREMKKDGDFGFPVLERPVSENTIRHPREFKRDDNGNLIKDSNGNPIKMTDEEYQDKMDSDVGGLFEDLAELDAKDRGIVFKPKRAKGAVADDQPSFSPSKKNKKLTNAEREAARRVKEAEKDIARQQKQAQREAKETLSDNIDMPWLKVAEIMREGVEQGDKFEFEISGKFTAKEKEIFERRFGVDTTNKLSKLLYAVNTKGVDLNNAVMVSYKTKRSQKKNFTEEGNRRDIGNEKYASTERVRKFVPYKVYIGFERGKRTQRTNRAGRAVRTFAVKNARLYAEAIDMDARMNRAIHAWKHARADREGFSTKTVHALFGTFGELEHAVNRLMSNYSRGDVSLAGADFFGGGRDGAMKRNIVNAIIGAHPDQAMLITGAGIENYPSRMQLRGGVERLQDPDNEGILNEAYTTWTTLRIDRMTSVPKSLHGEGFYYNHDSAYDFAKGNYSPQKRGHLRDHEGNALSQSESEWTRDSVLATPTGEPIRVYLTKEFSTSKYQSGVADSTKGEATGDYAYLKLNEGDLATARDWESAKKLLSDGKKAVKIDGTDKFYFSKDSALIRNAENGQAVVGFVKQIVDGQSGVSFSPQRRRPTKREKDLTDFSYRAIQKVASISGPEGDTPLAVLAEMSKGEFEQWLINGTIGINKSSRAKLGFNKTTVPSELALRHMGIWDQMVSKMHAINYHAELGLDHTKLEMAGNKIMERVLETTFEDYRIAQIKRGLKEPTFEEYLAREYQQVEMLRSSSRDQILRFIASYDISDKVDGIRIPKESWRRVHDAVTQASEVKNIDAVEKNNIVISLLIRDLRESGNGNLARKLSRAITRSMEKASQSLKANAEKMFQDGTVSLNWRETVNVADYTKVIRTDLTGHYIKEVDVTEMDDQQDAVTLMRNLKKLGAVVTEVRLPTAEDIARFGRGEMTKAELNASKTTVYMVFSKDANGKLVQQFAYQPDLVTGEEAVQTPTDIVSGGRAASQWERQRQVSEATGGILEGPSGPKPDVTVKGRRTKSKIVKVDKVGYNIWTPDPATGKILQSVAEGDMLTTMEGLVASKRLTAQNYTDIQKLGVPLLAQMTKMAVRTKKKYSVYRPHGHHVRRYRERVQAVGENFEPLFNEKGEPIYDYVESEFSVPSGTSIKQVSVGPKSIVAKDSLFDSLDDAKKAVVDDISANYSHSVHLKSHVGEVSGVRKSAILDLITSSTNFKFKDPFLFRTYMVGDYVLVTGRYKDGRMRSLKNLPQNQVFGTLERKARRFDKFGKELTEDAPANTGLQSPTNYAEVFRYVKGENGLPDSIEKVTGVSGELFRSEADVRKFINEASQKSSGLLSKIQLASRLSEGMDRVIKEWNYAHSEKIVEVLLQNPPKIRMLEQKMRDKTKPLVDITERVRKTYGEQIKDENMLASEQIARLFELKNEKGEYLSAGVVMEDQFGTRHRPPSETLYRKSRAYKLERGMHKSRRVQARNEDGSLKFDDNNSPVYEMTEESLQNDSPEQLSVYMEPILQNQFYEMFKIIGFLEITQAPWRNAAPQWLTEIYDNSKSNPDYVIPYDFGSYNLRSEMFDAIDDGRSMLRNMDVTKYGDEMDSGITRLRSIAEAFRQLQSQYDNINKLLKETNEDTQYMELQTKRDQLVTQLQYALGRKAKKDLRGAQVRDMTEFELQEYMEHAESVKKQYEQAREQRDIDTDVLRNDVLEADKQVVQGKQEYVPIEGQDPNWVMISEMRKIRNMVMGDVVSVPSHIIKLLTTKPLEQLLTMPEFKRYIKGDKTIPKSAWSTPVALGQIPGIANSEHSTREAEMESVQKIIRSLNPEELRKLSETDNQIVSLQNLIYNKVMISERQIRQKELEFIRMLDPAQRFVSLIPALSGDPASAKYFSVVANEFDTVIKLAAMDNLVQTEQAVTALLSRFRGAATAQHAKPFEKQAEQILMKVLEESVGVTFKTGSKFKELFGQKNTGAADKMGIPVGGVAFKGLIETHGVFSAQVRQWVDNNTFTEKPVRRFKHSAPLEQGQTEGKDSTKGIYLSKRALEELAKIEQLRDQHDSELVSIEKAETAMSTKLLAALSDYNQKRMQFDRETSKLYEEQATEIAKYWDEEAKTGELYKFAKEIERTHSEDIAYVVGTRIREFFTRLNGDLNVQRTDMEKKKEAYIALFRKLKTAVDTVPPEIAKNWDMYRFYNGDDAAQIRLMYPNTWAEFMIRAAVPTDSVLGKLKKPENIGRADVSHQVMAREQMFYEFRKAFGVSEIELFEKARGLLEYHTKFDRSIVEPENAALIARYFPEEANALNGRIREHAPVAEANRDVGVAIERHMLHRRVLANAISMIASDQKRIKDTVMLLHGSDKGKVRWAELQKIAQSKGKRLLVDWNDLAIEELESVMFQMGNLAPYNHMEGAPLETLTAQELLEGPMFRDWAEKNITRKEGIGRNQKAVLNSIFDTPQMQAHWTATPFMEKMHKLSETVARIRREAAVLLEKEKELNYESALNLRVSQALDREGYGDPVKDAERAERIEKAKIEHENAERFDMLGELFRKLNVVDTSMRAFKNKTEAFFKNREEARTNLLATRDEHTLHEIPKPSGAKDTNTVYLETPSKRYLAMRKPNGSVSLIFNGYAEPGKFSVKAHSLGTYPDMERAQIAIRFAEDDMNRLTIISEYAAKHGEMPPDTVTHLGGWVSNFLNNNRNLLSDSEVMVLKEQVAKVGIYPETAMIELKGLGRARKVMIYPNSKIWDLLHSGEEYQKGDDGVWRRIGHREVEKQAAAKVEQVRSQVNQTVESPDAPAKVDGSKDDAVSTATDELSSFEVKQEAPVFPENGNDSVSTDWIVLRNRLGYELRRIQEHKKGKWVTYYRMFNPAAGMIAESANEEDVVAEMYKEFINGYK